MQYLPLTPDPLADPAAEPAMEPWDGISIEWFDSASTLSAYLASERPLELLAREGVYVDHENSGFLLSEETVKLRPQDVDIAYVEFLVRQPTVSRDEFSQMWHEHSEQIKSYGDSGVIQGYIQPRTLSDEDEWPGAEIFGKKLNFDGVALGYFDSVATVKGMGALPADVIEAGEIDAARFTVAAEAQIYVVKRHEAERIYR